MGRDTVSVCYHEDLCTKIKRLDPDTWFIFNLHRELFLFEQTYIFKQECICLLIKK